MNDIDLRKMRVTAILNTSSGSCTPESETILRGILDEAGVETPTIYAGSSSEMDAAFVAVSEDAPNLLIVLGGDGTIRSAAAACADTGSLLVALPGGTMNMLPKALYGDRDWEEALRTTLASPRTKSVSGGEANGHRFFIAAIAGAPVLWTDAREALREGALGDAVGKGVEAFKNMLSSAVTYSFSGEAEGDAEAVAVVCPLISEAMEENERTLEAAAITVSSAGQVLGLASSAAFGAWRDDANVSIVKTKEISITSNEDIPLILDGETMDLGSKIRIEFIPEAFTALVPRS